VIAGAIGAALLLGRGIAYLVYYKVAAARNQKEVSNIPELYTIKCPKEVASPTFASALVLLLVRCIRLRSAPVPCLTV